MKRDEQQLVDSMLVKAIDRVNHFRQQLAATLANAYFDRNLFTDAVTMLHYYMGQRDVLKRFRSQVKNNKCALSRLESDFLERHKAKLEE